MSVAIAEEKNAFSNYDCQATHFANPSTLSSLPYNRQWEINIVDLEEEKIQITHLGIRQFDDGHKAYFLEPYALANVAYEGDINEAQLLNLYDRSITKSAKSLILKKK
eukprot:358480_1